MRCATIVVALSTVVASARASTFVIDDNGGSSVDFTDIQPAIDGAQPGDVLIVNDGVYTGFVLTKGLSILASPNALVSGPAVISSVAGGERAAIVRLRMTQLDIVSCTGLVLVQQINSLRRLEVSSCFDVRLSQLSVNGSQALGTEAMRVDASRVELAGSSVIGEELVDSGINGQIALRSSAASRLHVVDSSLRGGRGGNVYVPSTYAGYGAPALLQEASGTTILAGQGSIVGGDGGWNLHYWICTWDGGAGNGISTAGVVEHSGVTITGGYYFESSVCQLHQAIPILVQSTGSATLISPVDPTLRVVGSPTPGSNLTFTVRGVPGDMATLYLGRSFVLNADPGVRIEELVARNRIFDLGVIGSSGEISRTFSAGSSWPLGTTFGAQAELLDGTTTRRTNSTPVIVR